MEIEPQSFESLISSLRGRSESQDPRRVRLASLVSAVTDVISSEGVEVSPLRVWKATISTLEGSLQTLSQEVDLVDSICTQTSLLEFLHLLFPFVDSSAIPATWKPTASVLINLRDSILSLRAEGVVSTTSRANDGLDYVHSILREFCNVSVTLIQCVSGVGNGVDGRAVKQFFRETLRFLLNDEHEGARKSAKSNIGRLLEMKDPRCHSAVLDEMNKLIVVALDSITSAADPAQKCIQMKDLLDIISSNIMHLDFATIGEKQMGVIVSLIGKNKLHDEGFVVKKNASSALASVMNLFLATILRIVDSSSASNLVDEFAGRVLATLLQIRPSLAMRGGDLSASSTGHELVAQLMVSAAGRLIKADGSKGAILLPLAINNLFLLALEHEKLGLDISTTQKWFLHLKSVLQTNLPGVRESNATLHARCCHSCLKTIKPILRLKDGWVKRGPLLCLAELLIQIDVHDEYGTAIILELISLRENTISGSDLEFAVEESLSRVVQHHGLDRFWDRIDFSQLCLKEHGHVNYCWLLAMFRQAALPPRGQGCASLGFFKEKILPLARQYDSWAKESERLSSGQQQQVAEFWSLFPCFCVCPNDLAVTMPTLIPVLVRAMNDKRYPQLQVSIPVGIDCLARGVNSRLVSIADLAEETEFVSFRSDVEVVKGLAERLLPTLFKLVDDLYCDDEQESGEAKSSQGDALSAAITSLAKLSPASLRQSLFTKLIHRLLESSQSQGDYSGKMCSLLALSQALYTSHCLDESSVVLLYRALRPLIGTDEIYPRVQKRSYKLLGELCKSKAFVLADGRLKDLIELVTSSTATSQVAARAMRLRCLESILGSLGDTELVEQWLVSSLLGEILLCLKDSNKRTRDASLALLLSLSKRGVDIMILVRCIVAAIASETSHMRSAAVTAISKIIHEHGRADEQVQDIIPSLLETVLLLVNDPSREVTKSMILCVRVSVTVCNGETIRPLVPAILEALLKCHNGKDRFREKIKIVLKKLLRIFGQDCMLAFVPDTDSQTQSYIKKLSKTNEKAHKTKKSTEIERREKSIQEMLASDEEDSDDEQTLSFSGGVITARIKGARGRRTNKRERDYGLEPVLAVNRGQTLVRNDTSGSNLDVRDLVSRVDWQSQPDEGSESDDDIAFDDRGRLVVTVEEENRTNTNASSALHQPNLTGADKGQRSTTSSRGPKKKSLGDPYRARRAGGDIKRKDQRYDPYAYVPLDGRLYAKKNRRHAVEQFDTIVRSRKRQKR